MRLISTLQVQIIVSPRLFIFGFFVVWIFGYSYKWRKEVLFGTLIISDNGLPLLSENIFQTPSLLFGLPRFDTH